MKQLSSNFAGILLCITIMLFPPILHAQRGGPPQEALPLSQILETIEPASLSQSEREGILLMHEEEKLAHDLYEALYEAWNIPIFANIAKSEASHMEWVKLLITRYALEEPGSEAPGEFDNKHLKQLYEELLDEGTLSLASAFEVGATVEDLDIFDLERLLQESDNKDIKIVYQNLNKGSRNHLRSFNAQLHQIGKRYIPKHIDQQLFRAIIESENERGVVSEPNFMFPR
ncbi:DUF2202 domain-containing protein [Sediminispirochaeta smaragdinae]|jgi:hypothetical protein|uniref:DUF2202 domain-containing protein n=1 Tax=Sediminispirochaeta smaragdinae (strain DSM 11293 / JCM 15392 / SEBR 4228) TaxID=573413 RepID=E1RBB3_SEDSS|nr:DUF2202 domain-containing protein [Sediminispirochaeta smaragdinae]ADK79643.1 Protein of unknown function DUF2202 [Sediminispirochaeta smaragdinae DSM 11293]